jgi:Flp pilus assembly protein TadB
VGGRQRSEACEELSAQFAAGRLNHEELEDRLSAAVAARTDSEPHRLLADLPSLNDPQRQAATPVKHPRLVGVPCTVLDALAVIALVGCVLMTVLGALLVLLSGVGVVVAMPTLTAVVAGVGSASGVHLVHRAWASHDVAAGPSGR